MRQFIISTVLSVIGLLGFAVNSNAQSGTYNGTLSNITMNGNSYNNAPNQNFTLTSIGGNLYNLTGTVGPIGSMPGTIYVDLDVSINNGVITPNTPINDPAGKLVLLNGGVNITIKLSSFTGTLVNNELHFVLNTYAGWQVFPVFPASVTFDGTLQP
ncbi:hypothetical protein [Bacteroides heparinolyticus]|uniref:hypothetical protein n=1 Tax=Prevotella heparinolytica TaxID=28113 RepID=UPI0023F06BE3|nr:hypothetical protein [Bacteroides heparinolyticus]MCF0257117.1 hypothetical protein [Bacteroides heparinolyticus]MCI6213330.1 calycin-like domain-containing protein [Bacteroides heparinolyticus]